MKLMYLIGMVGSVLVFAFLIIGLIIVFKSEPDCSTVEGRMQMRAKRELEQSLWSMIAVPIVSGIGFIVSMIILFGVLGFLKVVG